jgi:ubiquitin-conjugating enzyme E2 D/E
MIVSLGPNLDDPEGDPMVWYAKILGPPKTPFAGGTFLLKIKIPEDYPHVPPNIEFVTPIFHPNVLNGVICIDLIDSRKNEWKPCLKIETAVFSVVQLLQDSSPETGFDFVSELMLRDRPKWFT